MSGYPYDDGGILTGGRVLVAPIGTKPEAVLTDAQWTEVGKFVGFDYGGVSSVISRPRRTSYSTSIRLYPLPLTRREKRQRNAFMRMIWGGALPKAAIRRQLIHKGGKP